MANMAIAVKDEHDPWKRVFGPASACLASIGRNGWDVPTTNAWRYWIDRKKVVHVLASTPIHRLKKTTV